MVISGKFWYVLLENSGKFFSNLCRNPGVRSLYFGCYVKVFCLFVLETISVGGYIHSLSPAKTSRSNKRYFDFKLNCGTESIKCVCFDVDKRPFFQNLNGLTDIGANMDNVTRPVKDIIVSYHAKVSTYKPEFQYSEFKKPTVDLEYIINEADVYDEVDIIGKLFSLGEVKTSHAGNNYIDCIILDITKRERSLKIFGDVINSVKEGLACKLTDVRVVLGKDQRKVLHTTTSTSCTQVTDVDVVSLEMQTEGEVDNLNRTETVLEGTVISIDMSSLAVLHLCAKCSTSIEINSGFYCCTSCNMMGTIDSVTTIKPKIGFRFKDLENTKHDLEAEAIMLENFTGHTVLNKLKLAMHLCKMPPFLLKHDAKNIVTSMEVHDVIATNMEVKSTND